ncbi:MAG: PKD repeat protein [Bacteroidia bacterium]|jgi:PKD repeat protein
MLIFNSSNASQVFVVDSSTSSKNALRCQWSWGDGHYSYAKTNASNVYSSNGTYTICLVIQDSICRTVVINDSKASCFAPYGINIITPDSIVFTNLSTASSSASYVWDFGDGTTSTAKNPPVKKYASNIYQSWISLSLSDSLCKDTVCNFISFRQIPCRAKFQYTNRGDTVWFQNYSTGFRYLWTFGDGDSSTQRNPVHCYTNFIKNNVCLTVWDSLGTCSDSICDWNQNQDSLCSAYFTYANSGSLKILFTNASQEGKKYFWDFGDSSSHSNQKNPSHPYSASGTYWVRLSISDSLSGCVDTINKKVVVQSNCKASYQIYQDSTQQFKLFLVNTSSKGSTRQYSWDFGDGGTASTRNPSHTCSTFGAYLVCLTITDSNRNCTSTFCDTLGLDSNGKLLKAGFVLDVLEGNALSVPETVQYLSVKLYPNPNNLSSIHILNSDRLRTVSFE